MKKLFIAVLALVLFNTSQAQLKTPSPSTTQTVKQEFGISTIELSYSRPGVKERKIFGTLVPFGKLWRTGANGATTLTFGDEVIIDGKKIEAGKYGLLSIPNKKSWDLIITKQTDVTGPTAYKPEMDIVKITVPVKAAKQKTETFTIGFENVQNTTCDVVLSWDKSIVILPISANIDEKIMRNIDASIKSEKPAYFQAATYYLNNAKDLNQALIWFKKAADDNPKAFWIQHQMANCLAKLGKLADAKDVAQKSMELAKEAKNDDYVKLNQNLLKQLSKSL